MKDGFHVYRNLKEFLNDVQKFTSFNDPSDNDPSEFEIVYFELRDGKYDGWCYKHDHCKICSYFCPFNSRCQVTNVYYHNYREEKLKRILR